MTRRKTPYKPEEAKRIYDIIYELLRDYKFPNSIEQSMNNWKKEIKFENDFSSICYKVCKDLYEAGYR